MVDRGVPRRRVPDLSRRCQRCLFPPGHCLCPEVPRIETRARFILLRHAAEMARPTNTARWAALALPQARLLDYALPGRPFDDAPLRGEGTWVLFPSPGASARPAEPPRRIVVLDGTWSQARRMLQRIPALRAVPRLSLPPPSARRRLRRPTVVGGMSTIEAVAEALRLLGEPEAALSLEALHARALLRAEGLRGPLPGRTA